MPRFRDQALVLRELDWSETSQILTLLTLEHGKIRGLAKGSKRLSPSSVQRFSGGFELLTRGEILATTRPTSELAALTEWDLQEDYPHVRQNLLAWRAGMYAVDLANALLAELDPHPASFHALAGLLERLKGPTPGSQKLGGGPGNFPPISHPPSDISHPAHVARALLDYQWVMLVDAGYRPELGADVHTSEPLPDRRTYTFDPLGGGLTLGPASVTAGDWRVRAATVALLRTIASGEPVDGVDSDTVARANRLLASYLRVLLDKELPTMGVVLG